MMSSRCKVDESLRRLVITTKTQGMTISDTSKDLNRSKSVMFGILKLYDDTVAFNLPTVPG